MKPSRACSPGGVKSKGPVPQGRCEKRSAEDDASRDAARVSPEDALSNCIHDHSGC